MGDALAQLKYSGARQCLGMKMSKLESKVLIFKILRNFKIEACEKTTQTIKWSKVHFNRLDGRCWL